MSQEIINSKRLLDSGPVHKSNCISPDTTIKCKKIGNYVLSTTIGTGTFSKVKLGIHLATQQKVAIKILDKERIKDENDIERISREIHILKALRHPNIAQLYETITSERHIYIIMEYIEGRDLFQYIYSKNYLDEAKASFLFRQLISALEYIHTLGIVHRDIKPENILLDKTKNTIKLVDFGLSNSYKHGDLLKTACGSPCYASPEMISGKAYNGLYSDLWSCGVVLYCMLSGKLPFDDEDIKVLYEKIKTANYSMPSYLSDIAKDFLHKILRTNPDRRIRLDDLKKHPFFLINIHKSLPLAKGILIGIEDIPIDIELVQEIKKKYYSDKPKVTEDFICDNISSNNHNNLTAVYYLLLKQKNENIKKTTKNESKSIRINSKLSSNIMNFTTNGNQQNMERKKCDMFNLSTIKKISFENITPQNNASKKTTEIINNSNTANTNNRFNVVVINTFVGDSHTQHSKSKKKNSVTVNLDSQNKLNASTSFTNNIITTKINLNDMISNQLSKQKGVSRNIINLSQIKRNKTVSSTHNNNNTNFSINLNNTLNAFKAKPAKSKEIIKGKFIFNSPTNSQDNLSPQLKTSKPLVQRNTNHFNHILNKSSSKPRQFSHGNHKYINKYFMKKIFENESFLSPHSNGEGTKTNNNNNNTSFNLNMTCFLNNNSRNCFGNKEKNNNDILKKPLKTSKVSNKHTIQPTNTTNIAKNPLGSFVPRLNMKVPNKKSVVNATNINSHNTINKILRKNFSLSMNKSKSKEKVSSVSKDKKSNTLKSNSLNKKKNSIITNTSIVHLNNNNNMNNNNINLNKKNNKIKIGFGSFNLSNVVKKNFTKDTKNVSNGKKNPNPSLGRNVGSKNNSKNKSVKKTTSGSTSLEHSLKTVKKNVINIKI